MLYRGRVRAQSHAGTRGKLLEAAVQLVEQNPGDDVSLRAVCAKVGVRLPTLYHFFGSKEGLLDAVRTEGFELYLAAKRSLPVQADPVQVLREGWDGHVAFGLAHPGLYLLMYGQTRPGELSNAHEQVAQVLLEQTQVAMSRGVLRISATLAAEQIMAAVTGVTLAQIGSGADPELSQGLREAVLSAIVVPASMTLPESGAEGPGPATTEPDVRDVAGLLVQLLPDELGPFSPAELAMLRVWLERLNAAPG